MPTSSSFRSSHPATSHRQGLDHRAQLSAPPPPNAAPSAESGVQHDVALVAALQRHGGDLKAAARELDLHPSRVFQRVLGGGETFDEIRSAVQQWLAQNSARPEAWLSLQPDSRDAVSDMRRHASEAERRAVETTHIPEKIHFFHAALRGWLDVIALEPTAQALRSPSAIENAASAVDSLVAWSSEDANSPWPAVKAALAGDFSACVRLVPGASAAGQPVATDALRVALAARDLHQMSATVSQLTPHTEPNELQGLLGDVRNAMKTHPHHATQFLALAVEAYGRTARLSPGQPHIRKELRAFAELCDDAERLEGKTGAARAKMYEADAWRLAGQAQQARTLLGEAAEAAGSDAEKKEIATARLRLEFGVKNFRNAIRATEEIRAQVTRPEERAVCDWIAGELWSAAAHERENQSSSFDKKQIQSTSRDEKQAAGTSGSLRIQARHLKNGSRPTAYRGRRSEVAQQRVGRSDQSLMSASGAFDQARAAFVRGRQELMPLAQGIGILPPTARRIAQGIDLARVGLRTGYPTPRSADAGQNPSTQDVVRLMRVLDAAAWVEAQGIALGRLLDDAWLPSVGHASGQMGAFANLVSAPFDVLPAAQRRPLVSSAFHEDTSIFGALGDILGSRQEPVADDEYKSANRILGARIARSLLPTLETAALPPLSSDVESRLRTAFPRLAQAFGSSEPTQGPGSPDAFHARLEALGFFSEGQDRYRYFGSDPALAGSVVSVRPQKFSGVGSDAFCYELSLGMDATSEEGNKVFVPVERQMHIGSLVFSSERWARVEQGYQDTLARAASALRTANGERFQPVDLADVRTLISLGRDEEVGGASRLERMRDRMELFRLSRRISEKASTLRQMGVLEGFQLEIGEENAAGKTTIGQMALDAVGQAGFATRIYSPKAPSEAEKKQHPIQRHIDNGPRAGEAVFSDRTMAGGYAYNPQADETFLSDMAARRWKWDEVLFDAGIAQVSLQVNPGRMLSGDAHEDYATQTAYVMGKREARARVAQHLLAKLGAADRLTSEMREGLEAAAVAGPGYRDLESLHTGEAAALRAEEFSRRVSNPFNSWEFIGSLERHPSRVQILQTVLDKLETYNKRAISSAHEDAELFSGGEALPMPTESAAKEVWDAMVDAVSQPNARADLLAQQCDGIAARRGKGAEVELVLRRKSDLPKAERISRMALIECAQRALSLGPGEQARVRIRIFDPLWLKAPGENATGL